MSERLLNVGKKFHMKFNFLDGRFFYGQILDIPDTSRVSNFLSTRRYLRTAPDTLVRPRDVIIVDNIKYVVAEHGTGFYKQPIYKHFKLFEVDEILTWYQSSVTTDTVTGLEKMARTTNAGAVYVSTQPKGDIEDALHIQQVRKLCICDKDVKVDDKIGDYIVTKADKVLGVNLLELKKL